MCPVVTFLCVPFVLHLSFLGLFVGLLEHILLYHFLYSVFEYILYFLMIAPGNTRHLPLKVNYRNFTQLFRYFNCLPLISFKC